MSRIVRSLHLDPLQAHPGQWAGNGDFQYVFCHPVTMIRVFLQYADDGRGGRGRTCPLSPYDASAVK
jgi:hypothetical protein